MAVSSHLSQIARHGRFRHDFSDLESVPRMALSQLAPAYIVSSGCPPWGLNGGQTVLSEPYITQKDDDYRWAMPAPAFEFSFLSSPNT